MLQSMRELSKSWVFKTLMTLLVISFGIWGIGDIFRGNPQQRTVAEIGKRSINVQALDVEFQQGMTDARKVFGADLTAQQARQIGVLDRTLNLMVERSLFDQEATRLGLRVDGKTIMQELAAQPQFHDKDGKFNVPLWQQVLRQSGMSEQAFIENGKVEEARRQLVQAVESSGTTPKLVIDTLYAARGQKRILDVLTLSNASMGDVAKPDDATLRDYYDKPVNKYVAPEYRALTIAVLDGSSAGATMSISEDDLKKAYTEKAAELTLPEQRDLVQIVVQDEAKAKAIAAAAEEDGLVKAAKAKGSDAVSLNRMDEKNIPTELYAPVFALAEGEVTQPIKTALGWHVVQVKKIYAGGKPNYDDAKEKLRGMLQQEQSIETVTRTVNQLDDALAANRPLEELADSFHLRLIKIPALTKEGRTADDKEPKELPAKAETLRTAFGQGASETSQIIEDRQEQSSNYLIVRTDEVTPSQPRAFEDVKATVTDNWRDDQLAKKAAEEAENIAKTLREGKSVTSFASHKGLDIRMSKPITLLGSTDRDLPIKAGPEIMKMKKGDVITSEDGGRQFILRLHEIHPVDLAHPEDERQKVVDDLEDKSRYEMLDEYSKSLRLRYPVTVKGDVLEMMRKQGS